MTHQFFLKDPDTGTLFHLPDTPPDFHFDAGRSVEKFEMAQDSEVHLPGLKTLFNRPFEFLLPSERGRSYAPKDWNGDPYPTVEKIVAWSNVGKVLRLIITGTSVNYPVLLADIQYGEEDGTGDVKISISFCRYRYLGKETTQKSSTGNLGRTVQESSSAKSVRYTVQHGDTLYSICRKHYGNGFLCKNLAKYNSIKNPNIIKSGQRVTLPPVSALR